MSTQEILIEEIKHQPDPVLEKLLSYLHTLESQNEAQVSAVPMEQPPQKIVWPDFMAELRRIYGDRKPLEENAVLEARKLERY